MFTVDSDMAYPFESEIGGVGVGQVGQCEINRRPLEDAGQISGPCLPLH